MTCSVDGCNRGIHSRSLCNTHYSQAYRGLREMPEKEPRPTRPIEDRFWKYVRKSETCWEWVGPRQTSGYGKLSTGRRGEKETGAHRLSYEIAFGPIQVGMEIDHRCFNRLCVNPSHLRAVTSSQNKQNWKGLMSNNTSGVRGVSFDKRRGKFLATVSSNKRRHFVGYFDTLEEAATAVRAKRLELHTHNDLDRLNREVAA